MQNHTWSFVFRMVSLDRMNGALAAIGSSEGGENDGVRFTIDSETNSTDVSMPQGQS